MLHRHLGPVTWQPRRRLRHHTPPPCACQCPLGTHYCGTIAREGGGGGSKWGVDVHECAVPQSAGLWSCNTLLSPSSAFPLGRLSAAGGHDAFHIRPGPRIIQLTAYADTLHSHTPPGKCNYLGKPTCSAREISSKSNKRAFMVTLCRVFPPTPLLPRPASLSCLACSTCSTMAEMFAALAHCKRHRRALVVVHKCAYKEDGGGGIMIHYYAFRGVGGGSKWGVDVHECAVPQSVLTARHWFSLY